MRKNNNSPNLKQGELSTDLDAFFCTYICFLFFAWIYAKKGTGGIKAKKVQKMCFIFFSFLSFFLHEFRNWTWIFAFFCMIFELKMVGSGAAKNEGAGGKFPVWPWNKPQNKIHICAYTHPTPLIFGTVIDIVSKLGTYRALKKNLTTAWYFI